MHEGLWMMCGVVLGFVFGVALGGRGAHHRLAMIENYKLVIEGLDDEVKALEEELQIHSGHGRPGG